MNIFVTGANRGLGLSFVKMGAEKGHHMLAGIRTIDRKNQELYKLQSEFPERIQVIYIDVTEEKLVKIAKDRAEELGWQLDGIINNAGVFLDRGSTFQDVDLDAGVATFNVNTFGPMRVIKHFHALLTEENPFIINISSDYGSIANTYDGDYFYGMSKAALNMYSEKLNRALKDVRVLSVHPGWLQTDMGSEGAPLEPEIATGKIYDIIEGKVKMDPNHSFIDYEGYKLDF